MRESELISELQGRLAGPSARLVRGIGDDAAVVRAGRYAVVSVDTMVDGVHFRGAHLRPAAIGHRALAAALSDLAAMGAEPGETYLALGLPRGVDAAEVRALLDGVGAAADQMGTVIAGGDITRAPALSLSFTVIGWAQEAGTLVGRDGARPGDAVVVTGALGGAGAGLALIEGRAGATLDPAQRAALHAAFAAPQPRFAAGRALAIHGARAMLDLSDGVASDAVHLAQASGVQLELELGRLPLAPGLVEVASELGSDPRVLAATAGEDYELCACLPAGTVAVAVAAASAAGWQLTRIGTVTAGDGVTWRDAEGRLTGFEHAF